MRLFLRFNPTTNCKNLSTNPELYSVQSMRYGIIGLPCATLDPKAEGKQSRLGANHFVRDFTLYALIIVYRVLISAQVQYLFTSG